MHTINFQPLGFEGIPQHRAEARQRYYDAVTKPWSEFGNIVSDTAGKVGDAMYKRAQDDKAEEWRQRQWTNQMYNQYLQNRRYQDERNRQLEERDRQLNEQRLDTEAADRLRQEFMGKYGSQDLSGYGLPAQFAMDRIRNARTWQEVVGAGNALTQAIQYQEMLRGQQEEQQRERFIPNFIKDYDTRLAYENQVDFNKPEQTALGYTKEELGTKYSNLMGEKEDLEALIVSNPAYKNPEVVKRLNDLDAMTKILRRRIMAIRHPDMSTRFE